MRKYTKEYILEKLRETATKIGSSFKATEFERVTGIDRDLVSRIFGSWYDAMTAAELEPIASRRSITKPELIAQAKILAAELQKETLTKTEWKKKRIYSEGVIRRRFGSWPNFLKEAGLKIGRRRDIPNDELLAEMGRLHNLLGKKISTNDMNSRGEFSSNIYIRRWGSWKNAWSCYLDSPYVISSRKPQEIDEYKQLSKRYFGEIINIHGLLHAPVNELGVIYLFALASKRLGYNMEAIQSEFPDAVAKRMLPGQKHWESIRIEFEYESSSFKKHGHDPKGCDLIVCWQHDWKECPLPVLELRKIIKALVEEK